MVLVAGLRYFSFLLYVVCWCHISAVSRNNIPSSYQLRMLPMYYWSSLQASCRAPNSISQTRWPSNIWSGAGGVLCSRWRCVSVVTQRKGWPHKRKTSQISFFNQARWSRRPLLVITITVNYETILSWRALPDLVCSQNQKLTNAFICLRVGSLTGCPLRSNKN